MLLDSIPNSLTKENGTNQPILNIPVAAMLSSKDAVKLRTLILKTQHGVRDWNQILIWALKSIFLNLNIKERMLC